MLEIIGEIILGAVIFSKMGPGKDTGKLLFKKVFSNDSFSIQDGETGITFSSGGGSVNVNDYEIAYGTGNGVTSSSFFKVCTATNKESIFGFSSIRTNTDNNIASYVNPLAIDSFIVGGASNSISSSTFNQGQYDIILGGCVNSITLPFGTNTIIGGFCNCTVGGSKGSIISSNLSKNDNYFSSLISVYDSCTSGQSFFSSIISSSSSCILDTGAGNLTCFNLISSSTRTIMCNSGSKSGLLQNNLILSSDYSFICVTPTFSNYNGEVCESQQQTKFNTILSSKGKLGTTKSIINNCRDLYGISAYNNIISSSGGRVEGRFFNMISSFNSCMYGVNWNDSKPVYSLWFSNIMAGENNYLMSGFSNIISSNHSKDISERFLNTIMSGNCICIELGGSYNSMIGGSKNCSMDKRATILGGYENTHNSDDGTLTIAGESNLIEGCGIILGGATNSIICPSGDRLIIGGCGNRSLLPSLILGGKGNSTGFSRCESLYGQAYVSNPGSGNLILGGSFRGVNCVVDSTTIISGCNNKMTLSYSSAILSGCNNRIVNVENSIIAGGVCNKIEAHGIFGTISENWFIISQNYYGSTGVIFPDELVNRPIYGLCYTGYGGIKNSFIVGGSCNLFGSCIEKNYCSTYFNVGLTTSKSHYVYNSGVIGGCKNQIYNKSKILTENYSTAFIGGRNQVCNSVIVGGRNIKLSKSCAFATCDLIITGSQSASSRLWVCLNSGISGTYTSVTSLTICEGLVISVTGIPSDSRLKIIIRKIGVSNSGLNIYLFRYINENWTYYTGVIAQELLGTPYELALHKDSKTGFYRVDYSKIDVEFKEVSVNYNQIKDFQ